MGPLEKLGLSQKSQRSRQKHPSLHPSSPNLAELPQEVGGAEKRENSFKIANSLPTLTHVSSCNFCLHTNWTFIHELTEMNATMLSPSLPKLAQLSYVLAIRCCLQLHGSAGVSFFIFSLFQLTLSAQGQMRTAVAHSMSVPYISCLACYHWHSDLHRSTAHNLQNKCAYVLLDSKFWPKRGVSMQHRVALARSASHATTQIG